MFSRPFRKKGTLNATTFLRTFRVSARDADAGDARGCGIKKKVFASKVCVFHPVKRNKHGCALLLLSCVGVDDRV